MRWKISKACYLSGILCCCFTAARKSEIPSSPRCHPRSLPLLLMSPTTPLLLWDDTSREKVWKQKGKHFPCANINFFLLSFLPSSLAFYANVNHGGENMKARIWLLWNDDAGERGDDDEGGMCCVCVPSEGKQQTRHFSPRSTAFLADFTLVYLPLLVANDHITLPDNQLVSYFFFFTFSPLLLLLVVFFHLSSALHVVPFSFFATVTVQISKDVKIDK